MPLLLESMQVRLDDDESLLPWIDTRQLSICFLVTVTHAVLCSGLVSVYEAEGKEYHLGVELQINLPGLSEGEVQQLIDAADRKCPFSNAVRGNVNVKYTQKQNASSEPLPSNI